MNKYEFAWEAAAAGDLDSLIDMHELGYPLECFSFDSASQAAMNGHLNY